MRSFKLPAFLQKVYWLLLIVKLQVRTLTTYFTYIQFCNFKILAKLFKNLEVLSA
jgi:hypothetical protein